MEKGARTILYRYFDSREVDLVVIGTFFCHFVSQVLIDLYFNFIRDNCDPKGLGTQPQELALVL